MSDDRTLARAIGRAIGLLPEIDLKEFSISVVNGRARLAGVVHRLSDKTAAIEAAWGVPGITGVDDAIAVETPIPPADEDLTRDLGDALDDEEEVDALAIGARSRTGQAVMVGSAGSLGELARAINTAGEVANTISVIDSSRIENPHGPDQPDLANAVADVLGTDPVLRTRPIRAFVEETGKIVLRGQVRAPEEKERALTLAATVPGVHTAREELDVVP